MVVNKYYFAHENKCGIKDVLKNAIQILSLLTPIKHFIFLMWPNIQVIKYKNMLYSMQVAKI